MSSTGRKETGNVRFVSKLSCQDDLFVPRRILNLEQSVSRLSCERLTVIDEPRIHRSRQSLVKTQAVVLGLWIPFLMKAPARAWPIALYPLRKLVNIAPISLKPYPKTDLVQQAHNGKVKL